MSAVVLHSGPAHHAAARNTGERGTGEPGAEAGAEHQASDTARPCGRVSDAAAAPAPSHVPAIQPVSVNALPQRPYAAWRPATLVKKKLVRDAAAKLLSRATIHSVTPEDVSLAAGLTKSSCYYYYGTRDALLADMLTEHLVALDAAVCAAFDATARAEASVRMTALAYAFLRVALTQRAAHLALRLNAKLVSDARRPSVMARSRQVTATLRTALEECVPGLESYPAMTGLLMRQFVGGLSEAVTWFKPDTRMNRRGLAGLIACQVLMTARAVVSDTWVLPHPAVAFEPEPVEAAEDLAGSAHAGPNEAAVPALVPHGAPQDAAHADAPDAGSTDAAPRSDGGEPADGASGAGYLIAAPGVSRSDPLAEGESEPSRDAIWLTPEQARRSLTKLVRAAGAGTEVVLTHRGVPTAKLVPATRERQRMRGIVGGRLG